MTTTETAATGTAMPALSPQAVREFRRTRHRLSSVVYTPNDAPNDGRYAPRGDVSGAKWETGSVYQAPGCGATTRWQDRCTTPIEGLDFPTSKEVTADAWVWLESKPLPQIATVCADLKLARTDAGRDQLRTAAKGWLERKLDADLEWQFWKCGQTAPVNAPMDQVVNGGDPLTPLQAADLLSGYLQCSDEQLVVHTTGTLSSIWARHGWLTRGAGRNTLETMVGGHLVSAGCYPAWCSPADLPDLTPEEFASGLAWVAVSARPFVRIGGYWDEDRTDEPVVYDMETSANRATLTAERSLAVDSDCCNRLLLKVQYCEPDEAPIPEG